MARPLRLDIEGGWYHVMNRGLEKRQIFPDEQANLHFVELLSVLTRQCTLPMSLPYDEIKRIAAIAVTLKANIENVCDEEPVGCGRAFYLATWGVAGNLAGRIAQDIIDESKNHTTKSRSGNGWLRRVWKKMRT
jgi:putative transposase